MDDSVRRRPPDRPAELPKTKEGDKHGSDTGFTTRSTLLTVWLILAGLTVELGPRWPDEQLGNANTYVLTTAMTSCELCTIAPAAASYTDVHIGTDACSPAAALLIAGLAVYHPCGNTSRDHPCRQRYLGHGGQADTEDDGYLCGDREGCTRGDGDDEGDGAGKDLGLGVDDSGDWVDGVGEVGFDDDDGGRDAGHHC